MGHQELKAYQKRARLYFVLGPEEIAKDVCIDAFISENEHFYCIRLAELIKEQSDLEYDDMVTKYGQLPDFRALPLVEQKIFDILKEHPYAKIILDGYPRYLGELKDLEKTFSPIIKHVCYFNVSNNAYMQQVMEKRNSSCLVTSEHSKTAEHSVCKHCISRETEASEVAYNRSYKNLLRHKFNWEFIKNYCIRENIPIIRINAEVDIKTLKGYFKKNILDDKLNPEKAL